MGKKDFDNILKVIKVENTFVAGTLVSQEVDLELPRGFVAKIWKVKLKFIEMGEDWETQEATTAGHVLSCGLQRDPDDTTTVQLPRASVQHDGIFDHSMEFLFSANATPHFGETETTLEVPEHIDLITARNMRFNSVGGGPDVANLTESIANCAIYYTLEKVTDDDILNLLDIL